MLAEQINQEYIQAMKNRDSLRVSTLSFLRAQIKNVMIDRKSEKIEDADVIQVIKKQAKQRQDSIEQYEKGGRPELAAKEKQELDILKEYLPEEMSADQLRPFVDEAVKEAGATSMKDMGRVMKALMSRVAGKADNKMISRLVKQALSSQ
ncbi:MAG: GatB/YqeY domain-containing protein [Candidatus Omnitrophica bacterium]|nr:GatB/YqeY domain-containing protein [Candidatus Omnitrophota bacterium]